jgi:isopenicillin N synthase-like dioxygenase
MTEFMAGLGSLGERLLELVALGLGRTERDAITRYTVDGWHHLRAARSAALNHGVSSHGLLVITPPDIGGLCIRPGDVMQFLTGGLVRSTSYGVDPLTYFHEPNFEACVRPLFGHSTDYLHYGTYFTGRFMQCYPDRITTRRIIAESRLAIMRQCLV